MRWWLPLIVSVSLCANGPDEMLMAVHATYVMPTQQVIAGDHNDPNNPRATLHFSLGSLAPPVGPHCWEECPYAVVCRLGHLVPQLVNINCYDTFIVGNLPLTDEMWIVAPASALNKLPSTTRRFLYDGNTMTLRDAIAQLIEMEKMWLVTLTPSTTENQFLPALHNGQNINTIATFAPLVASNPHLSVGLRFVPHHGQAYLLGLYERSQTPEVYAQVTTYLDSLPFSSHVIEQAKAKLSSGTESFLHPH